MRRSFYLYAFITLLSCHVQGQGQGQDVLTEIRVCEQKIENNRDQINDSLLYYAKRQYELATTLGDSLEIGKAHLSLGYANRNMEIFEEELKHFMAAKGLFEGKNNKLYSALAGLEIVSFYKGNGQTMENALRLLHTAKRVFRKESNFQHYLVRSYIELGLYYRNKFSQKISPDSILIYNMQAYQLATLIGETKLSGQALNNIADFYLLKPYLHPDTVVFLSNEVIRFSQNFIRNQAVANLNIYLALKEKGETDNMYHYLSKGHSLTTKIRPSRLNRQASELLINFFIEKKMYDSAMLYYMNEKKTSQKLASNNNYLNLLFDNATKEAKITEQENEIITAKLNQQRVLTYVLITGGLALMAFTIVIIRKNIESKRKSLELQRKNDQIQSLIKEIHHRVKNNLQMIVGLLDLQESSIPNTPVSVALNDAGSRIKSIALVHQKLYTGNADMVHIGFPEYISELCENLIFSYNMIGKIDLRLDIDEIETSFDKVVVFGLLTTELITNALKHAFRGRENGLLEIKIKKDGNNGLILTVKDNGIGIPPDLSKKKDSFGIDLIKSFVDDLEGTINFINNGGATVEVKLAGITPITS